MAYSKLKIVTLKIVMTIFVADTIIFKLKHGHKKCKMMVSVTHIVIGIKFHI